MRIPSKWSATALLAGLVACGDAATQPELPSANVTASSALAITGLSCRDVGGGGYYYNNTICFASADGGAGGYAFEWDVIVTYQQDSGNTSYIEGVCTEEYPVTVTVRDAGGATASMSETFPCYATSTGGGGLEP